MASLDKTTVRNEVIRLKDDFEQLCADGKITRESKVLMSSMFMIIELILSIFLEKSTRKGKNENSGPLEISHSNFYIESEVKTRLSRLILSHAMGVPLFMTAGHPISPINTAGTGCAVRTCCASSPLFLNQMIIGGRST